MSLRNVILTLLRYQVGSYQTEVKYKNVNFKKSYSDIDDEDDNFAPIMNSKTSTHLAEEASDTENVKIVQRYLIILFCSYLMKIFLVI